MKTRTLLVAAASLVALTAFVFAEDKKDEVKLDGVKCVMKGDAPAKAATAVDYKGGKIFFCCKGCAGKFDAEKCATSANKQLVATKQFKQVNCPVGGGAFKADQKLTIDGVDVCFCCANCKAKVEKAEGDAKSDLVFNNKAFDKAFKTAKK